MALCLLRAKLFERILPLHIVKGPLSLHKTFRGTVPKLVQERSTLDCAPSRFKKLCKDARYTICSSSNKVRSGSIFICGGRNFSSSPPLMGNISKMNSSEKGLSGPRGQCKCECDCSRHKIKELAYRIQVCLLWMTCFATAMTIYNLKQLHNLHKVLDDLL